MTTNESVDKKGKPKCGNCGCDTRVKPKGQNGKGDVPRPSDNKQYNKNYESINWSKK